MAASVEYVLSQLLRWTSSDSAELSDPVLLERFVQRRDEALAGSVLKGLFLTKLVGTMTVALTLTVAASVTVALVYRGTATETPEDKPPAAVAAKPSHDQKPQARTDALGDPLPDGAIARLGTVRFRHGDTIFRMAFSPDGKRLVSMGLDGVRVWDAATGKELRHLKSETGQDWTGADLSSDGKQVGVWRQSPDVSLELWDVDSGKKAGSLPLEQKRYFPHLRFSPDGKLLVALSWEDNKITLWELSSRKKLRSWQTDPKQVSRVAFSADSRQVFTRGMSGEIRLWDVATGRQLQELKPLSWKGSSTATDTALAPDGKIIAMTETNEKRILPSGKVEWQARISLWDTATGKQVRLLTCPAPKFVPWGALPFSALTFTPDGKSLLTTGPDYFVRVWDTDSGKELRRLFVEGPPDSLALSRDGKKLAVRMGPTAIRVLDVDSGKATTTVGGHLSGMMVAFTPDGRTAVTANLLSSFIWDVSSGRIRHRLEGHNGPLLWLQLGRDGRTLFTNGLDKTLRVWDLATGKEQRRITVERDYFSQAVLSRLALTLERDYFSQGVLGGLALTSDGKTLAVMDGKNTIRVLDAVNGAERQHFQGPDWLLGMRLTPDGRLLIAWSGDYKVGVWDTATGRKLHEYPLPQADERMGLPDDHYNAALSSDGRLLAMGPQTRLRGDRRPPEFLILKDLATGQDVHRIDQLPSETALVAFSPDGRMLAWTGYTDATIRVLETASGRERRLLVGHRGQITALAFSADGRRLLSGSQDTTALVWDLSDRSSSRPANADEIESLWSDLAGKDAAKAYRAIHRLALSPSSAIFFMLKYLHPVPTVDEKRLTRLVAELDSDDFTVRRRATAELEKLGEQAIPSYRKALASKPSLETRRRVDDLLDKAQRAWWDVSGERLRSLRAVEALELAGSEESRDVLKTLAAGANGARLTEEAKAALERLASRERHGSP